MIYLQPHDEQTKLISDNSPFRPVEALVIMFVLHVGVLHFFMVQDVLANISPCFRKLEVHYVSYFA